MLYTEYLEKMASLPRPNAVAVSEPYKKLVELIGSQTRVKELISVLSSLSEDWEENCLIREYSAPEEVKKYFKDISETYSGSLKDTCYILGIVVNKDFPAKKGKRLEYYNKNRECCWEFNDEFSEFQEPEFHCEHKLIWVSRNILDDNSPFIINVYIPPSDILNNVALLKKRE